MTETILSAGAVSMLILQFIVKPLLRKYWLGEDFNFSPRMYVLMVTILNIFVAIPLALLDVQGYSMPTDWGEWSKAGVVIMLQALTTFASYELTVSKMNEYKQELRDGS